MLDSDGFQQVPQKKTGTRRNIFGNNEPWLAKSDMQRKNKGVDIFMLENAQEIRGAGPSTARRHQNGVAPGGPTSEKGASSKHRSLRRKGASSEKPKSAVGGDRQGKGCCRPKNDTEEVEMVQVKCAKA